MKRKTYLKMAAVAVVAAVAGVGVYSSQKADAMSDIALANMEALAQGEVVVGPPCQSDPYSWCIYMTSWGYYVEIQGLMYS